MVIKFERICNKYDIHISELLLQIFTGAQESCGDLTSLLSSSRGGNMNHV